MRILVLTLMMSFLSHSAFGAAEGGGEAKIIETTFKSLGYVDTSYLAGFRNWVEHWHTDEDHRVIAPPALDPAMHVHVMDTDDPYKYVTQFVYGYDSGNYGKKCKRKIAKIMIIQLYIFLLNRRRRKSSLGSTEFNIMRASDRSTQQHSRESG